MTPEDQRDLILRIADEAMYLCDAHSGQHNMHGHCGALTSYATYEPYISGRLPIDWTNVGRLIISMRITAKTGKFPRCSTRKYPGEYPYDTEFTPEDLQ